MTMNIIDKLQHELLPNRNRNMAIFFFTSLSAFKAPCIRIIPVKASSSPLVAPMNDAPVSVTPKPALPRSRRAMTVTGGASSNKAIHFVSCVTSVALR